MTLTREEKLIPNGKPKYLVVFKNEYDNWYFVFSRKREWGEFLTVEADDNPHWPNGIYIHGGIGHNWRGVMIVKNGFRKASWAEVPEKVKEQVMTDYRSLWEI